MPSRELSGALGPHHLSIYMGREISSLSLSGIGHLEEGFGDDLITDENEGWWVIDEFNRLGSYITHQFVWEKSFSPVAWLSNSCDH